MNGDYDALQGQLEAISLILTGLIASLPAAQAARAKVEVEAAFNLHCENEREDRKGDLTRTLIREAVMESFIGLLAAAAIPPASRGG